MDFKTADLCDEHDDIVSVAQPIFRDFGGVQSFAGKIFTLQVYEDNSLVRSTLEGSGNGRVLVVDGGASAHCALLGDNLARLAHENGWAGVIVNGFIRDAEQIAVMPVGVKALGTLPRKSVKRGRGETGVPLLFAGVNFKVGHYVYADRDGIIVAPQRLLRL